MPVLARLMVSFQRQADTQLASNAPAVAAGIAPASTRMNWGYGGNGGCAAWLARLYTIVVSMKAAMNVSPRCLHKCCLNDMLNSSHESPCDPYLVVYSLSLSR